MSEDERLRRAIAAAEAAEADLRRLKASLIPAERVDALRDLLRAEVAALIERETASVRSAIAAAQSPAELQAALEALWPALLTGLDGVRGRMLAQGRSWTLAGLEDLEREVRALLEPPQ